MALHHDLGQAGGATREKPQCRIIRFRRIGVGDLQCPERFAPCHAYDRCGRFAVGKGSLDQWTETLVNQRTRCRSRVEDRAEMSRSHLRVDHHCHGAFGDDPQEGGGIVGTVRHGHHDALSRRHGGKTVDVVAGQGGQLAIGPGFLVGENCGPVAVSLRQPFEQKEVDHVSRHRGRA